MEFNIWIMTMSNRQKSQFQNRPLLIRFKTKLKLRGMRDGIHYEMIINCIIWLFVCICFTCPWCCRVGREPIDNDEEFLAVLSLVFRGCSISLTSSELSITSSTPLLDDSSFMSMTGFPRTNDQTKPWTVSTANITTKAVKRNFLMLILIWLDVPDVSDAIMFFPFLNLK